MSSLKCKESNVYRQGAFHTTSQLGERYAQKEMEPEPSLNSSIFERFIRGVLGLLAALRSVLAPKQSKSPSARRCCVLAATLPTPVVGLKMNGSSWPPTALLKR